MNPGKLRHLVSIQHHAKSRNEYGEVVESWSEFAKAWAEVKPIKSNEYFAAFKERAEVTHRVVMRYIDGIKPSMRIEAKGRVFEIVGIRNFFERDEYLEVMCKEVIDG